MEKRVLESLKELRTDVASVQILSEFPNCILQRISCSSQDLCNMQGNWKIYLFIYFYFVAFINIMFLLSHSVPGSWQKE